jgi:hemerythrin-like domain-containing protein
LGTGVQAISLRAARSGIRTDIERELIAPSSTIRKARRTLRQPATKFANLRKTMKSIERLVAEHDLIERVLVLLEHAVQRIDAGKSLPKEFPTWAAMFFQQFADQGHHAKEEDVFFPLLKERGIPEEGGPIGVMLHEHVLGRDCVGRMRNAAQADTFDSGKFAEAAKEYIPLLRQHIYKENNILFCMAEQVMSSEDDANVVKRFEQVEQGKRTTDSYDSYLNEVVCWEENDLA